VFVLERLFHLVMYPPLLQQLLLALACGSGSSSSSSADAAANSSSSSTGASGSSSSSSVSCRSTLLGILGSSQLYPAVMVLRLLVSILHNRHISPELLAALSILPRRAQQQHTVGMGYGADANGSSGSSKDPKQLAVLVQALLSQLQGLNVPEVQQQPQQQAGGPSSSSSKANSKPTRSSSASLLTLLTQQYLPNQLHALVQAQEGAGQPAAAASSSSSSAGVDSNSSSMQGLEAWLVKAEEMAAAEGPPGDAAAAAASNAFSALGPQLLAALLQLLQQPGLPAQGLRLLGWLLHQLLPVAPLPDSPVAAAAVGTHAAAAGGSGQGVAGHHSISHMPITAEDSETEGAAAAAIEQQQQQQRGLPRQHSASSSADDSGSEDSSALAADSASLDEGTASRTSSMISGADISTECESLGDLPPPVSSLAPSASFRSVVGQDQRGALLAPQQQQLLQAAVDAACGEFRQQLRSMWCEAVFPMLAQEWPVSREMLQRPVLRAGSDALLSGTTVWPLLQGLQAAAAAAGGAGAGAAADALSVSGKAALACYLAVQRVVALTQLQEVREIMPQQGF
jgi:hypothetical protein